MPASQAGGETTNERCWLRVETRDDSWRGEAGGVPSEERSFGR